MGRVVLVGLDNPHSTDPRYALFPHPPGCSGYNLWRMLSNVDDSITRHVYLRAFERMNLFPDGPDQRLTDRRHQAASRLLTNIAAGGDASVFLFGKIVRDAVMEWKTEPFDVRTIQWGLSTLEVTALPHPSGLNRDYNDPSVRERAARAIIGARWPSPYDRCPGSEV